MGRQSTVCLRWFRRIARDEVFRETVDPPKKFRNPDTENEVDYDSLPTLERARIYRRWRERNHPPEKERKSPRGVIPVDKAKARAKAKQLAEYIVGLKSRAPNEPLGSNSDSPWPVNLGRIVISDVKGRERHVPLTLTMGAPSEHKWRSRRKFVNGGKATHRHRGEHDLGHPIGIEIELDAHRTPAELAEGQHLLEEEIHSVLIHELTHAQDLFTPAQTKKHQKGRDPRDPAVYHNNPAEVRAFTQQVTDELEKVLHQNFGKDEDPWFPDDADLLRNFLEQSFTWHRVKEHMTPESRKKILRSAYDAVARYTQQKKSKNKVARAWAVKLAQI